MFAAAGVPYLTAAIVAVNVIVALASLLTTRNWVSGELGEIGVRAGLLGGGVELHNGVPRLIGIDQGEWYRVFTGAFLHAGPIHLGFNMLLLWQVGSLLEPALGRIRFGLLYLVALLGGSFGALLAVPDGLTVGASGAVFGLMGALFVAERAGAFGGRRSTVGFLIVINLVLTVAIPGISVGGHVGGLLSGGAAGWMFVEFERRRLPAVIPAAVCVVAAGSLFVGSLWAATLWSSPIF
jgi:membrane associated rhomboid family serine protease